ncbi:hypothetical protein MUP95_06515, partial [bacterium]|nr:hypothetical protein [bacterium]
DPSFLNKQRMIALTKIDLLHENEKKDLPSSVNGQLCFPISSVTGEGVQRLLDYMITILSEVME